MPRVFFVANSSFFFPFPSQAETPRDVQRRSCHVYFALPRTEKLNDAYHVEKKYFTMCILCCLELESCAMRMGPVLHSPAKKKGWGEREIDLEAWH